MARQRLRYARVRANASAHALTRCAALQLQGGDFTDATGTGGESIYGLKFPGALYAGAGADNPRLRARAFAHSCACVSDALLQMRTSS